MNEVISSTRRPLTKKPPVGAPCIFPCSQSTRLPFKPLMVISSFHEVVFPLGPSTGAGVITEQPRLLFTGVDSINLLCSLFFHLST